MMKPMMLVGTASDVGKSVITAAFCRIFRQDGYHPAPFKAQNMSLNSYATPEGLEIGRAQAVQAEAAGIPCHTDMNPVLLKPTSDKASQIVLNGKPVGTQSAWEYFMADDRQALFTAVTEAYDRLAARYSPIVMEGAGSISELNLRHRDITNLRMAIHAGAATYLIGDIDRGGLFGSVYGTIALLTPEERTCIQGIIVNKFRGDARLFEDGKRMLAELTGVPVVGVLPYYRDIYIEEEDSVALDWKRRSALDGKVNVAVVLLHRMSNFTDFNRLERDPRVNLYYAATPRELEAADVVILPGSKNTVEDLISLRQRGMAAAILSARKNGKTVIGICGGYQMMGESVEDPEGVESTVPFVPGLGLLPVRTVLTPHKTTNQRTFTFQGATCSGYEIHMGVTSGGGQPVAILADGTPDGCRADNTCWGTYLHGILDNDAVVNAVLEPHTAARAAPFSYPDWKEEQYDKLADWLRSHIDLDYIYGTLR
ncbi:cobyric acid synthase [Siphonobacter aquaeclarae]|uniref:Cobyric acid synthase n=1 Tax=Siphonobacter aquaeclarae TaxID=563176 RepID=A0A1G9IFR4_9BACT|nr:cobyric acid synthase [Siphonobacter aquaeclarae]SDL23694.1 adenosylcobyric acid synthase (glutamine-hydrolysing) [Siphonobacter aquaeclarae]